MIRLSFIVPFYNVEQYIEECIHSLYNQDIPQEEYEVICVDDCSLDGSRAIVERLEKDYPTLKLLTHTENKRQGGARNTGLKAARGRYIWFVDSDDAIFPNVLAKTLKTAEQDKLDILQFDYTRNENEDIEYEGKVCEIQDGENYLFSDKSPRWSERVSGPWQQIFRKQFLLCNNISFVEDVQYEDTDFILHAFIKAKRVLYMSIRGYIYRENQMSTTQMVATPQKLAWRVNQLVRCAQLIDKCETQNAKECIKEMLVNSFSYLRNDLKLLNIVQKCNYLKYLTPFIKECRQYMNLPPWLALRYGITWFV